MKNVRHNALLSGMVCLALAVPNGTQADKIVPLGAGGLRCYTQTPQATAEKVAAGLAPQGLEVGQASVALLGIRFTAFQTVADAVNQFDPIYLKGDGTLTKTAANGDVLVGYALATIAAPGEVLIAVIG